MMQTWTSVTLAATLFTGWTILPTAQSANLTRFHHVHLNSTDLERTFQFYQKVFGALPVKYGGTADALFTGRGFILASKVAQPPTSIEQTAVRHIGWAGVDGPNEFAWWQAQGVEFHTPLTPLGQNWFFYMHKNSYYADSERRLPPDRTLETSRGSPIDHFAFSYADIEPAFERMRAAGAQIVDPIRTRDEFGFKSFFVMGPDRVLIEVVEAKPIPDALW